jgi:hypothetical protein
MTEPREIIQDYKQHFEGEREVVNWTRLVDGRSVTYFDVPVMYLREVTREDFERRQPHMAVNPEAICFWEVSVD